MRKSIAGTPLRWLSASFAVAMLALAVTAAATAAKPYVVYRSTLLHSCWHPRIVIFSFEDGVPQRDWGTARVMKEHGFTEVEYCTGVEANYCFFNFRKGRMCKRVVTRGELALNGSYPVVTSIETARCSRLPPIFPKS